MNVFLICNSASGGGTNSESVSDLLRRHGATLVDSEHEAERIVVCGGDGTVGQGAELASRLKLPLGVIPAGTANDFARALELSDDLDVAAELAVKGTATRRLELGRMDSRPFVNVASAGLAPAAGRRAEPLKRTLGPLAYPAGALLAGVREKPISCVVHAGGQEVFNGKAWQVIVACTGAFGGGAGIDAADPSDGELDLLVLPDSGRHRLTRFAFGMRKGTLAEIPGVVHARHREITIRVPAPTSFNVDGEIVEATGTIGMSIDPATYALVVGTPRVQ